MAARYPEIQVDVAAERTRTLAGGRRFYVCHRVLAAMYLFGLTVDQVAEAIAAIQAASDGRGEVAGKIAELAEIRNWVTVIRE